MPVLDSRDLIKELDSLEWDLENADLSEDKTDEVEEQIEELKEVIQELEDNCDEAPRYGIQLVPEDEWVGYVEELIADCYSDLNKEMDSNEWPYRHIHLDYEAAAEELEDDYAEIEFRGIKYLCR